MTNTSGEACGHECSIGGIAYRCERKPHPVDGYGPKFRHAAGIDAEFAKGTDEGDGRGEAELVTWGEDDMGGDQDCAVSWSTLADYGTDPDAAADEQESDAGLFQMVPVDDSPEG